MKEHLPPVFATDPSGASKEGRQQLPGLVAMLAPIGDKGTGVRRDDYFEVRESEGGLRQRGFEDERRQGRLEAEHATGTPKLSEVFCEEFAETSWVATRQSGEKFLL